MVQQQPLVRLIYYSEVDESVSDLQLQKILMHSQRHNDTLGITGLLVYDTKFFMQIVEGNAKAINQLYNKITQDSRHQNVSLIEYSPIEKKYFETWSMQLARLPTFPRAFVEKTLGGFMPSNFTPQNAREFLEICADALEKKPN